VDVPVSRHVDCIINSVWQYGSLSVRSVSNCCQDYVAVQYIVLVGGGGGGGLILEWLRG